MAVRGHAVCDVSITKSSETLCMKGLVLIHMGQREEGIELVKKGMRLDLTSHICWHVFGLIQKGEKNYAEALKSYTQALKFDKDNLNILRDSAQLQTQLRMYDGLVETRLNLLRLRPNLRQHWIGLAVAHCLNNNLDEALRVIEHYQRSLKNVPDYDVEQSETNLFHIHLLTEKGDYAAALSLLDVNAKSRAIVDKTAIMTVRADLLTKMSSSEAEHAWGVLVEHNPECYDYYAGYFGNLSVKPTEDPSRALEILEQFVAQMPKATAPRRLSLTYSSPGDSFIALVRPYLLTRLVKGVPSLFTDLKSLYVDREKMLAIQAYVEELKDEHTPREKAEKDDPTVYLWILYFLAQHYSYLSLSSPSPSELTNRALDLISTALDHTPTLPELFMLRARVLKRAGDYVGAAREMDIGMLPSSILSLTENLPKAATARLLDLQDRFLNTKSSKYWLRAGCVEKASEVAGLFTKKDAPSPASDLEDMQSLLWMLEEGDAHFRTRDVPLPYKAAASPAPAPVGGEWGKALKRYIGVSKVGLLYTS